MTYGSSDSNSEEKMNSLILIKITNFISTGFKGTMSRYFSIFLKSKKCLRIS